MKKLFRVIPLRVAITYFFFAGCWIYFSGQIVSLLTDNPHTISTIETYKGFAFVLVTTILLYFALRKRMQRLQAEHEDLLAVQKELTHQEIKYRNLFEHSPYAIIVSVDEQVALANQACVDLFRAADTDDLLGKIAPDLFYKSYRGNVREKVRQVREKGEAAQSFEAKILALDGKTVDVMISIAPFSYDSITGIHLMLLDITEKKHQEAELRLRNLRLAALFDLSSEMRKSESSTDLFKLILERIRKLLQADSALIALLSDDKQKVEVAAAQGSVAPMKGEHFPVAGSVFGKALELDHPCLCDDITAKLSSIDSDLFNGLGPALFLPLYSEKEKIGVLALLREPGRKKNAFSKEDLRLLNAIGDSAANTLRRLLLYEQSETRLAQTQALRQVDLAILNNLGLKKVIRVSLEEVQRQFRTDAAAMQLWEGEYAPMDHFFGQDGSEAFRTISLRNLPQDPVSKALRAKKSVQFADLQRMRKPSEYLSGLAQQGYGAYIAEPIISNKKVMGALELISRKPREFSREEGNFLKMFAGQMAIAIENASLLKNLMDANQSLIQTYDNTIEGWSRALDMRDKETEGHTLRVTELTLELARKMNVSEKELVHIRRGALLHDIGKMGVPDHILLKPGKLTPEEWAIMIKHPQYAFDMLNFIEYLRPALDIPYGHHEKWDGSGYPRGLKGEEIPKAARIFSVVDVWDALSSDRPYRPAWPKEKVLTHIRSLSGTHFDPAVVDAFLELLASKD